MTDHTTPRAAADWYSIGRLVVWAALFLACPIAARAGSTVLTVNSTVEGYYFVPPSSVFTVNNTSNNILTIDVDAPPNENGVDIDSHLTFAAGDGGRLTAGFYDTLRCDDDGSPRPTLVAGVPGPYPIPTHFLVKEISYSADNKVVSLDIVFGDFKTGEAALLVAEIMFNSSLPLIPPNHISSSLQEFGTQGQPFVCFVRASGPQTKYGATNLPSGLTIDTTSGRISGTPTTAGTFNIGLSATDSDGTALATLVLTVEPPAISVGPYRGFLLRSDLGDVIALGETRLFNRQDWIWSFGSEYGFGVEVLTPGDYHSWSFGFAMPGAQDLAVGHYELGPVLSTDHGSANLAVSAYGFVSASGSVDVYEVCVDPLMGKLIHLRASFTIEDSFFPGFFVRGEVWLDSEAAITSPVFVTAVAGDPFSYQIVTNISGPFSYEAQDLPPGLVFNSASGVISGTTNATGTYTIPITVHGADVSVSDNLTLKLLPSEHLLNLSTRGLVRQGDEALIAGFIVDAPVPKRIAIRALGTKLNGAPGVIVLGDPQMVFHTFASEFDDSVLNWMVGDQFDEIIALGLGTNYSTDDILLEDCYPGASSAVVQPSRPTASGISLVELYDVDPDAPSRMVNISTRGFVSTGDNVMIGGFILGGKAGSGGKLGIFAKGPSLTAAGLSGVLADPTLDLYDSNGDLLLSNDNWQDSQAAEIEASGLAPTDDHEAGIVIQLPLGAYTAIVRGKNETSGIGLVEVYDLSSSGH